MHVLRGGSLQQDDQRLCRSGIRQRRAVPDAGVQNDDLPRRDSKHAEAVEICQPVRLAGVVRRGDVYQTFTGQRRDQFFAMHVPLGPIDFQRRRRQVEQAQRIGTVGRRQRFYLTPPLPAVSSSVRCPLR